MSNVRALRSRDVSPAIVMQSLQEQLPQIEAIYVIAMMKDSAPAVWTSGDLGQMCHASILLQSYATDYALGRVEQE